MFLTYYKNAMTCDVNHMKDKNMNDVTRLQ